MSAYLLKKDPKNSYIRGKIITETKTYKKLVKSKHKQYLDQTFTHLDSIQHSDPHGYMQLVKSLRQGSFGKTVPADSDHVLFETVFSDIKTCFSMNASVEMKLRIALEITELSQINLFKGFHLLSLIKQEMLYSIRN